jgi:glutamate dehydrogenase
VPKALQNVVSVEQLHQRLPETYLRALFASYMSSRFVYSYGIDTSEFALFEYVQRWLTGQISA